MPSDQTTIEGILARRPASEVTTSGTPVAAEETASPRDDRISMLGRCRFAQRPQMMLAFRTCSDAVEVYPYAMLARIRSENPNRDFELQFTAATIKVSGANLLRLLHYVIEHRVLEIAESSRTDVLESDETQAVIVDRIEFDALR